MIVTRGLGLDDTTPIIVTAGLGLGETAQADERRGGRSKNLKKLAQERRRRVEALLANTSSAIHVQAVQTLPTAQIGGLQRATRTAVPNIPNAVPWTFYSWSTNFTYPTVQGWYLPPENYVDFNNIDDEAIALLLALSV